MSSRRGVFALVVLLTLLGAVVLTVAVKLRRPLHVSSERQILVFDVPSDIDEAPPAYSGFSLDAFRRERPTLVELTRAIRRAATDPAIRAMVLHVGDVNWGWARVGELRQALREFRAAGKPIHAGLEGGSEQEYLVVSGASRISMPPTALLQLDGLSASAMFLKGTYDKLGITPNFAHVGQFKSAVEQYTRTDLSPASRQALESLLDDEFGLLVDSLAAARDLPRDTIRRIIDDGPYSATTAVAAGLIDTVLDEADMDSLAAGSGSRRLGTITMQRYMDRGNDAGGGEEIAMVVASGTIVPGRSHESPWQGSECGSETLIGALREAREKRSVRAVILRIDSPGGSGQASDDIWQEVRRVRRQKPVVVSMSNLAASGGYYIACGADAIVAEPSTITGSIGVFGGKLNILGLYHKLGLNVETVSRGRHAEMMSPFRDFTPEEAVRFQRQMDDFYRTFIGRVSQGRGLSLAAVDSIGQGRVWSGTAARRIGLVDSLGDLGTAIEIARTRAGIGAGADIDLELYPRPRRTYLRRFLDSFLDENPDETRMRLLSPVVGAWITAARFPVGTALALMPYSIDIH